MWVFMSMIPLFVEEVTWDGKWKVWFYWVCSCFDYFTMGTTVFFQKWVYFVLIYVWFCMGNFWGVLVDLRQQIFWEEFVFLFLWVWIFFVAIWIVLSLFVTVYVKCVMGGVVVLDGWKNTFFSDSPWRWAKPMEYW